MLDNEYFVFTETLTTMTRKQALQSGQRIIIMTEKEFIDFLSQRFYVLSQGL